MVAFVADAVGELVAVAAAAAADVDGSQDTCCNSLIFRFFFACLMILSV